MKRWVSKKSKSELFFFKLFWGTKNLCRWWMQDSNNANSKLFAQTSKAKRKAYLVGFLCQLSTLSHSAPSHLSVDPLVPPSTGVAGAESRAIGISLCPTAIISFALTTHLLFTFTPEMRERGRGGLHRGSGKSRRWWTWKWASPPPPLHWVDGRICGVISCQSLAPGQEDIQAEVRPATFLLLVSLLKRTNSQESLSGNLCWKQKSGNSTWSVWFISDFFSHFKFDYNSFKFAVIFTVHVKHYCNDFLFSLQCQVGISLCFLSSCLPLSTINILE